mmetsp:Transcript_44523/g.123515  ORF Transcript_44523/g.123515 Transcript_44523/m.123515 type:complete len:209 (+) Transcript_44523:129-755(+)
MRSLGPAQLAARPRCDATASFRARGANGCSSSACRPRMSSVAARRASACSSARCSSKSPARCRLSRRRWRSTTRSCTRRIWAAATAASRRSRTCTAEISSSASSSSNYSSSSSGTCRCTSRPRAWSATMATRTRRSRASTTTTMRARAARPTAGASAARLPPSAASRCPLRVACWRRAREGRPTMPTPRAWQARRPVCRCGRCRCRRR